MTSSLVGSEMCIRDRFCNPEQLDLLARGVVFEQPKVADHALLPLLLVPVSYTHLTLPTICSV
eukprot:2352883-Prorocentrum_lima.AAC.1